MGSFHSVPHTPQCVHNGNGNSYNLQGRDVAQQSIFRSIDQGKKGIPSVIQEYCHRTIEQGHEECIWLCVKRGRRMIAQDIQLGTSHNLLGLPELRRCHGWWKRYSFFSSIGVKEIKIRFLDFEKSKNEIQVVATDFDHSSDIAHYNLTIEEAVKVEVDADKCGIDMMGRRHEKNFHCANSAYDNILQEVYCKIERVSDLAQLKSEAQWLSSMLEFYWQNGIGDKGLRFLRKNGFVTRYSSLEYDTYADAANPYGKTIKAFLLIEGWHVRYLLCLVAGSLVCSVCIVAIATVVTRSIEAGLTAGSYGLGLTAIVLAVLTLLSAII